MEQLRLLQQKSALLVKLRSDSSLSAQEAPVLGTAEQGEQGTRQYGKSGEG